MTIEIFSSVAWRLGPRLLKKWDTTCSQIGPGTAIPGLSRKTKSVQSVLCWVRIKISNPANKLVRYKLLISHSCYSTCQLDLSLAQPDSLHSDLVSRVESYRCKLLVSQRFTHIIHSQLLAIYSLRWEWWRPVSWETQVIVLSQVCCLFDSL